MCRKRVSGYVSCACRDCMEIAIMTDGKPALCSDCAEAGCEAGAEKECQASGTCGLATYGIDEQAAPLASAVATLQTTK